MIHIKADIVKNFGKLPLCNRNDARAPHIGTFCFPLCWRCSSICFFSLISFIVINVGKISWAFNWNRLKCIETP